MFYLKEHYHHFSPQKRGYVYSAYLESNEMVQYKTYTKDERGDYAKKHGYHASPGSYDYEKRVYYVNSSYTNAQKGIAIINSFKDIPKDNKGVVTHAFITVGGKDKVSIQQQQKAFLSEAASANERMVIKVTKVFFLPQLVGETKGKEYTWCDKESNFI